MNSLEELLGRIARVDAVVASRLHGVILSTVLYKPVLAVSYARKVDAAMADLGLSDSCLVPIRRFDSADLLVRIKAILEGDGTLAGAIRNAVSGFEAQLDAEYERLFRLLPPVEEQHVGPAGLQWEMSKPVAETTRCDALSLRPLWRRDARGEGIRCIIARGPQIPGGLPGCGSAGEAGNQEEKQYCPQGMACRRFAAISPPVTKPSAIASGSQA